MSTEGLRGGPTGPQSPCPSFVLTNSLPPPTHQSYEEQELLRLIYYGGIQPEIRKAVWPFLLGHYQFGMTETERKEVGYPRGQWGPWQQDEPGTWGWGSSSPLVDQGDREIREPGQCRPINAAQAADAIFSNRFFEIMIDSHALVRNHAEPSPSPNFPQW